MGYNEVYSSGQDDPDTSYPERVPFANSPFEKKEEDSDVDGSESNTGRDSEIEESYESPLRSVVKALFPDLDVSQVPLDDVAHTLARSIKPKSIDELFKGGPTPNIHGDGGAAPQEGQAQSVGNENHLVKEAKLAEKVVDEEEPVDQP
nr:hypothetical protein CFP56_41716 [Quercus suber]